MATRGDQRNRNVLRSVLIAGAVLSSVIFGVSTSADADVRYGICGSSYAFVERANTGTAAMLYGFDTFYRMVSYSGSLKGTVDTDYFGIKSKNFYNNGTLFFRKSWDGRHNWNAGSGVYTATVRWLVASNGQLQYTCFGRGATSTAWVL